MLEAILKLRQELWPAVPARELGFSDVSFTFPDGGEVFDSQSLTAGTAGASVLVGPNGRGKSTALRILAGFLKPQEGSVFPISQRKLSFSGPEGSDLPPYARCTTLLSRLLHTDNNTAREILETINLGGLSRRHIVTLSSGQKKRLSLFRALVAGRDGILLDEPLAHLDITSRGELISLLRVIRQRVPLIVSTHDPEFIRTLVEPELDTLYWVDGYRPRGGQGKITRLLVSEGVENALAPHLERKLP